MLLLLSVLVLITQKVCAVRVTGPSVVEVESGTSVKLTCDGVGLLQWLHNNATLSQSHSSIGELNVTASEPGLYTCTNGSSFDTVRVDLVVVWGGDVSQSVWETIRSGLVGGVIGLGSLIVLIMFCVLGTVMCKHNRHRVSYLDDMDTMEWEVKEEYVATLNLQALEKLSPEVRAVMDLDFLAQLTNTDPALLEKYKVKPKERTESIRASPSHISLSNVPVDLANQTKSPDMPITPLKQTATKPFTTCTPNPLRKQASFISAPTSHGPSMHRAVGPTDSNKEGVSDKQSFLRMLQMVKSSSTTALTALDQSLNGGAESARTTGQ